MSKRKVEASFFSESCRSKKETCYEVYKNLDSNDEEKLRFLRKKNKDGIVSSNFRLNIDKCIASDSEFNVDVFYNILQEYSIEEESEIDDGRR